MLILKLLILLVAVVVLILVFMKYSKEVLDEAEWLSINNEED